MAFGIGSGLGALGGGVMSGMETGMDLYQKLQDAESNRIAMQFLSGVEGLSPPSGGSYGAAPGGPPPPSTGGPMATQSAGALARGLPSVMGSPGMGMPPGGMSGGMVQPQAPGLGLPQGAMGGAPMGGGPGPGSQMTGSMPMLPQQMGPTAQAPRMSVQPAPLAAAREQLRVELESTPGLPRALDALTTAEVGKDPRARQMFQEGLLNRAAARNTSVKDAIGDRSYYPPETYARAQREGGTGTGVTPAMFDPINPSNLTNYGTGNASIDPRTGRPVGFAGGPQTAYYRGEQHGIEGPDKAWARRMGYAGPDRTALGAGGPQGPGGAPGDVGRLTAADLQQASRTGYGPLDIPQMARRIEQSSPNASPMAKFKAMQKVAQLMNQNGQTQFNQMMQMLQMQQRERFHADTERKADERSQRAQEGLDIRERSQLRNSPYVRGEEKQVTAAKTNLTNTELRMDKIKGHLDALLPVAAKVGITGNMKLDTWLQEARSKLGWTDETYAQYQTMLRNLQSEIAAMSQQTLGSLTVSAREDAKQMANGVLTPGILKSMGAALAIEGRVTKEATKNIVSKHQKNIDSYMRSKGEIPPDEEEAAPAAAAGTPAANDPLGIR